MASKKAKTYARNDKVIQISPQTYEYLEDGKHIVVIERAEIIKVSEGREILQLGCMTREGCTGDFNIFLESSYTSTFSQLIRAVFEGKPERLNISELLGCEIEVHLKTKGLYQNVYRIEAVEEIEIEYEEDEEAEEEEIQNRREQRGTKVKRRVGVGGGDRPRRSKQGGDEEPEQPYPYEDDFLNDDEF